MRRPVLQAAFFGLIFVVLGTPCMLRLARLRRGDARVLKTDRALRNFNIAMGVLLAATVPSCLVVAELVSAPRSCGPARQLRRQKLRILHQVEFPDRRRVGDGDLELRRARPGSTWPFTKLDAVARLEHADRCRRRNRS